MRCAAKSCWRDSSTAIRAVISRIESLACLVSVLASMALVVAACSRWAISDWVAYKRLFSHQAMTTSPMTRATRTGHTQRAPGSPPIAGRAPEVEVVSAGLAEAGAAHSLRAVLAAEEGSAAGGVLDSVMQAF